MQGGRHVTELTDVRNSVGVAKASSSNPDLAAIISDLYYMIGLNNLRKKLMEYFTSLYKYGSIIPRYMYYTVADQF